MILFLPPVLTHWGWVMHICVRKLTIIGSYNGLSPGRRQAIIWTDGGILLISPLGTNFSEILSEINIFSFKKMHLKTPSAKWRPFCLGLNVLTHWGWVMHICISKLTIIIPSTLQSCWVYWFHSVCLSVRLSFRPSIRPASPVHSVAPTVLDESISYLCILSSNLRRCAACQVYCKISKLEFLAISLNLYLWLCLLLTWHLMWITSMGNHGAAGGISEHRRSSCSRWFR